MQITTRDIGLNLRDELDGAQITIYEDDKAVSRDHFVELIDVSDPHNPKLFLSNGQTFTIRIIAT